jgi:L-fucose isomerase-like protein
MLPVCSHPADEERDFGHLAAVAKGWLAAPGYEFSIVARGLRDYWEEMKKKRDFFMSAEKIECAIGFIPVARTTFDIPLATEMMGLVRKSLIQAGYVLRGPEGLVTSAEEANAAIGEIGGKPIDLLLLLQATFADSTMALEMAEKIQAPVLLWALPEKRTGGRLRLNSFCGVNLAAHALKRANRLYDYVYAPPGQSAALDKIKVLSSAGRARRMLGQARIGRIGEHPAGFDSCLFDPEKLNSHFGIEVVQFQLEQIFQMAGQTDPLKVENLFENLRGKLDHFNELDGSAVRGTLSAYLALRRLSEENRLNGMAVRCWPQFFTDLKCAACGAMSMLSDEMIPCSCEADINGTITQLILQILSGGPAFGTDVVSFEADANLAAVWHCGLAPLSMADPAVKPRGTIHSNRLLPLLMEFPLKPGRVTFARLSEAQGDYRLVVGRGEMLRAPLSFSGTAGTLRFDRPASEVADIVLKEGLEHHMAITYGDIVPELLALAKILRIAVLEI